jgi:hypothetical protein
MSTVKRTGGNYDIYVNSGAGNLTVHGNLVVVGAATYVESTNSYVTDAIVQLNQGESGSTVTSGKSGLEIDRGSGTKAYWLFNEVAGGWGANIGASYTTVQAADPVNGHDVVTKNYLLTIGGAAAGAEHNVQYNTGGGLSGDNNFNYYHANGNVVLGNTLVANNATIGTYNNTDLTLYADGTGHVFLQDVLKMQFITDPTPSNVASTVQLLANTPGSGGTGLYFVNSSGSDELISKKKATVLALIFG